MAGSRVCSAPNHLPHSRLCLRSRPKRLKAVKHVMDATVMETATAARPVKFARKAKVATSPVVKAVAHAVKVVVTDATAVADAVDVAVPAVAAVIAKVARNASASTQKANPCRWTPTFKLVVQPKARAAQMPIAKSSVPIVLPANAVTVAVAADAVAVSAMKPANAPSRHAQKPVWMPPQKAMPTPIAATRANRLAKAVVKDAKVVKTAMAVVVATDVVLAKMAKDVAMLRKKATTCRLHLASLIQTTVPLPQLRIRSHRRMEMVQQLHRAARMVSRVRSASATVMAVNADPAVSAANAKSAQTCAFRYLPLCHPRRQATHLSLRMKQ